MFKTFNSLVALLFLCSACNNDGARVASGPDASADSTAQAFDMSTARKTIEDYNRQFADQFSKGDSASMAASYASDALVMPSNSEAVKKDAIAGFWGSAHRMGIKNIKLNITDLTGNAELLSETGEYELLGDDNKSIDEGKYVVVWKPENGTWKIYRDIWNSNMPAGK